jgi:hypothetical protein
VVETAHAPSPASKQAVYVGLHPGHGAVSCQILGAQRSLLLPGKLLKAPTRVDFGCKQFGKPLQDLRERGDITPYYEEFSTPLHTRGKKLAWHADDDAMAILREVKVAGFDMS